MRLPISPRNDYGIVILLATFVGGLSLPLLVYYLTLAPDLTWAHSGADGGDLIVAAYTLGVGHPPSFPAYTLLAHFFTFLPWGSVAYRVNFFSAVGAASAAGFVALAVSAVSAQESKLDVFLGAMAAAWGFAFMPLLWNQAVISEVYAVHAAFIALTLWLAFTLHEHPTIWIASILGLVWGISFGIHPISIFLLPLIIWSLSGGLQKTGIFRLLGGSSLGFCVAFLQWLYLPLRAGRGAVTWGDPTTLSGLWWMMSGSLYKGYILSFPLERWLPRLSYLATSMLTGLGPIAILLGLTGWAFLAQRRLGLTLALGLSAIMCVIFSVGYNTTDSDNYSIPALIIFSIVIGYGAVLLFKDLEAHWGRGATIAGWIVVFVMLALNLLLHWSGVSLKSENTAIFFGEKVMHTVPINAVLLTDDDRATFTLWYFHFVLGQRPDTLIIDKGLLPFEWYQAQLGISPSDVKDIVSNNDSYSRPVCQVAVWDQSAEIDCLGDR